MTDVQRVDFIAVPTRDRDRSARFYGETLGLERNPNSTEAWLEFETGNVTLALVTPEDFGMEFAPLPFGAIALLCLVAVFGGLTLRAFSKGARLNR